MSESEREKEPSAKNQRIMEDLRESFRAAERRLTHNVEPAVVYFPTVVPERVE